jgi:hypothetical protein
VCVIAVCEKIRLSDAPNDMLMKMFLTNKDGASIAWREKKKNGPAEVCWEKGIDDVEAIRKLCAEKPLPYVVHFRIQTVGGIWPELCHPFPIDNDASTALTGRTRSSLLFHNGTFDKWKDAMLRAAENFKQRIPDGKFSDTRAMAWLADKYGENYLNFVEARGVIFGPEDTSILFGTGGWNLKDDVWVSNSVWESKWENSSMCNFGPCRNKGLDKDGRCVEHPKSRFPFSQMTGNGNSTTPIRVAPVPSVIEAGGPRLMVPSPFSVLSALKEVERQHQLGMVSGKFKKKAAKMIDALIKNRVTEQSSTSHTKIH